MSEGPKLTFLGKLIIVLFIGACAYGAYAMFAQKPLGTGAVTGLGNAADAAPVAGVVEFGVAYGTEKERWLKWAVTQFSATKEGRQIKVNLVPMGSLEGAQAVLKGDPRIQVWSPASALYEDVFKEEWQIKYGTAPILRKEALALSPMVFVMWAPRYDAFISRYKKLTFETIGAALKEPGGWDAIAQKPEWGLFKFGHTHPQQSNSGLMTLVLMAYDYHKKSRGLQLKDILDPGFQSWMNGIENATTGLSNSTGNMMRDMVLRGPSSYDALCVYENVVIDYFGSAEGRWGELRVAYPQQNAWNDNPYYIIDAPWSSKQQRAAAGEFLDFLLSEPIQRESLKHGFRPGNANVPVRFADSPFVAAEKYGIQIDISSVSDAPPAAVISNLLQSWQRGQGSR